MARHSLTVLLPLLCFLAHSSAAESPNVRKWNLNSFLTEVAKEAKGRHFVFFHSPNCPHCVHFKPEFAQIADDAAAATGIQFGEVDCMQEGQLCQIMKINAYPTLCYFENGQSYKFDKRRSEEEIVKFLKGGFAESQSVKVPTELPSGMEAFWDTLAEMQEELYFTFMESDSLLLKASIGGLLLIAGFTAIVFFYFLALCCCLFLRKEHEAVGRPSKKEEAEAGKKLKSE